jgi:PPM family protein phosphatase
MISGGSGVRLRAFGKTDRGRVRPGNEDALLIADLAAAEPWAGPDSADYMVESAGALLAVSDGMGGAKAGEVASAMCIDGLYRAMKAEIASQDADADADADGHQPGGEIERLRRVVEQVSREVRDAATHPDRRGMGATLTAVLVRGTTAYVAEVGDSRAYLVRGERLCQITRDQSYVQMLVDAGAITPEAADQSPRKNLIMQVMGQREPLTVALWRLELRRGDRLLLCSDGLTNALKDAYLLPIASAPADLFAACADLVTAANEAGGEDNITVVLAEVDGEALPLPKEGDRDSCSGDIDTVQEFKP